MIDFVILSISILLQLTAALLSLRLIKETGKLFAWVMLSIALTLMAVRRIITLNDLLVGSNVAPLNLTAEIVALAISILMVIAVLAIKPVLKAIQLKDARFGLLLERSINEIYIFESETLHFTDVSRGARENLGYSLGELKNMTPLDIKPEFTRESFEELISPLRNGEQEQIIFETLHRRKDDSDYPVEVRLHLATDAEPNVFFAIIADITERKHAEQALRESEDQLRQSQKIEAVGQLTGGVAHDFNNLLAIIEGYLSLLDEKLQKESEISPADVRKFIRPALRAGRRGAELTYRLLAFSRKQPLQPVALDVNEIVEGMEQLLKRTLGEDIDLRWHLEAGGWLAEADASQLENAILNLAVNARDAMPDGGRLTIETGEVTLDDDYAKSRSEVTAGDYVMLAVSDTGTGMERETLAKVFEPFFTTKEVGKGTGLGLSMVFGFAKQSGGHVAIYSEPGQGTTVRLYVPRAVNQTETVAKVQEARSGGGHETILVVEDDEDVRDVAMRMLQRLGYTVFAAQDGRTALIILENEGPFDLLLTDVVLPGGMSGAELATAAQQKADGLKVLYMSGYTENAILHHGRLARGVNLIDKPFSCTGLGAKVTEVLESSA